MSDRLEEFLKKDAELDKEVAELMRLLREDLRELRERVVKQEGRIEALERSGRRRESDLWAGRSFSSNP